MKLKTSTAPVGGLATLLSGPFGNRIMLAPQEDGTPTPEEAAAAAAEKAAAEAAAAEKAAADKAAAEAAEKAAAEKAAAEKAAEEAAEKARKEAEDKMTTKERELLHEVMEKKSKLKAADEEKARLENELKRFDGIDVDEVKKILAERKQAEEAELERRGEFDRLKERIAEERAAEKATYEKTISELQGKIGDRDGKIEELTIGQTFQASTFINEDLVLTPSHARTLYGTFFDQVDGKVVGYDKPRGAENRTMLVDASGEALSFNDAMKRIIDKDPEKDKLIKAKTTPGASSKTTVPAGTKSQQQIDQEAGQLHGVSRIAAGLNAAKQ